MESVPENPTWWAGYGKKGWGSREGAGIIVEWGTILGENRREGNEALEETGQATDAGHQDLKVSPRRDSMIREVKMAITMSQSLF
jgi:hypothetical protein